MEERFKTFTILISGITRSIRRIKTEEMAEYNLKSPHVSCLYYLYKAKSLTSKELCDICEEDKASISRSVNFLEDNGYLICKSEKRYQSPLVLTEKGIKIGSYIAEKIDKILDEASIGLSDEERAILYKGLSTINSNLQNICDKY